VSPSARTPPEDRVSRGETRPLSSGSERRHRRSGVERLDELARRVMGFIPDSAGAIAGGTRRLTPQRARARWSRYIDVCVRGRSGVRG
jgi:hypothetical protein